MTTRLVSVAAFIVTVAATAVHATCIPPLAADAFGQRGTCLSNYTGICAPYVGSKIYLPANLSLEVLEANVQNGDSVIRRNSAFAGPACVTKTDWFLCSAIIFPCYEVGDEAVPVLPCDSECVNWWSSCNTLMTLSLNNVLHGNTTRTQVAFCENGGTFSSLPNLTPDVFGGRFITSMPAYTTGYLGQLRFPVDNASYTMANGSIITVECYVTNKTDTTPLYLGSSAQTAHCTAPLIDGLDAQNKSTCLVPCPFPVFDTDVQRDVQLAYIIPGFIGFFLCVFVCIEAAHTLMTEGDVVADAMALCCPNRAHSRVSSMSPAGKRRKPTVITSYYALAGSMLSIVFFFIGPLPSLVYGSRISCGNAATFTQYALINGLQDFTSTACSAQRAAPFILQMVFNLLLYSMVRVSFIIHRWEKRLDPTVFAVMQAVLLLYCIGMPVIFLIAAAALDVMPVGFSAGVSVMARQALICSYRLPSSGVEFVLTYLPFCLTGALICFITAYNLYEIHKVSSTVRSLRQSNASSDRSMHRFIQRLQVLAVCTFALLIIFMVTTTTFTEQISAFLPAWNTWFTCLIAASCGALGQECPTYEAQLPALQPSAALMGLQVCSMSTITVLFGLFFAMHALSKHQVGCAKWIFGLSSATQSSAAVDNAVAASSPMSVRNSAALTATGIAG